MQKILNVMNSRCYIRTSRIIIIIVIVIVIVIVIIIIIITIIIIIIIITITVVIIIFINVIMVMTMMMVMMITWWTCWRVAWSPRSSSLQLPDSGWPQIPVGA